MIFFDQLETKNRYGKCMVVNKQTGAHERSQCCPNTLLVIMAQWSFIWLPGYSAFTLPPSCNISTGLHLCLYLWGVYSDHYESTRSNYFDILFVIYDCPFVYEGHILFNITRGTPTDVINNVQLQCQDSRAPAETKTTLFLWPRR